MADHKYISIRGAREHNLKNVDLDLPRDKLIVMTGLSGSGKSSLAFDTIYAEGQRRYVESLSAYARQFLEMMQKPDVDQIDGLSPAISIEQKTTSRNPRSTVGTVTEIYDYMRLLFARVGVPYSPATGLPIESQTSARWSTACWLSTKAPACSSSRPSCAAARASTRRNSPSSMKKGFQRVKIDGAVLRDRRAPVLDKKYKHDIDVVVDRIVVRPDLATRLADSIETALKLADGLAVAEFADKPLDARNRRGRLSTSPPTKPTSACCSRRNSPARSRASPSRRSSRGCSPSTTPSAPAPACDGLGTSRSYRPGT
jgi:excinuclease ABC subunit A